MIYPSSYLGGILSRKLKSWWAQETCPQRLALTLTVSLYVALLPVPGFHTIIGFGLAWLLGLNGMLVFTVSHLIHNPITVFPLYVLEYSFGMGLFGLFGIDWSCWNPSWFSGFNEYLKAHTGVSIYFAPLFIGGNLLALLVSGMLYPVIRYFIHKKAASPSKS